MALPMLPGSYWHRIASITDDNKDETASRQARSTLMRESYRTFLDHPITGVGAGQFKNYKPEGRVEAWRESHNALLQVAAELGVLGLGVFAFLLGCGFYAPMQTRRLLQQIAPLSATGTEGPCCRSSAAGRTGTAFLPFRSDICGIRGLVRLLAVRVCGLSLDVVLPAGPGAGTTGIPDRSPRAGKTQAPDAGGAGGRSGGGTTYDLDRTRCSRKAAAACRRFDERYSRRHGHRRILIDARTAVNYTMVAPVVRALEADPRVQLFFTASEEPRRLAQIYREAPHVTKVHPQVAALMKFDAYVASDFMWTTLPRGTRRVQVFHGVAGKYGFDAPDRGMLGWDRFFFVNERRLGNFISAGLLRPDSPEIRLVGMPKVDCLVDGSLERESVVGGLGLDPSRPTVLYAPTWSPASSLNALGAELITAIGRMPVNLIVKLHDRSRDLRPRYSGGVDWVRRLRPLLRPGRGVIAPGHDISPYLVAADAMITDHSSAGFEYLLRDRPIVRIHRPQLIQLANIHRDYVSLLAAAATSVTDVAGTVAAVERGLADPEPLGGERRRVAAELFYRPGTATARSVQALYDVIELAPATTSRARQEASCPLSA